MKRAALENDTSHWAAKAQQAFNEFIRVRDHDKGCVSCAKPSTWDGQWAAGHYRTVGSRPDLRFNQDNVQKQCNRDCNLGKSGNVIEYRIRLIDRIGVDRVEALERDCDEPVRYRLEDYKRIYKEFKAMTKSLKQQQTGVNV